MKTTIKLLCAGIILGGTIALQAAGADSRSYVKIDAGASLVQDLKLKNSAEDIAEMLGYTYKQEIEFDLGVRFDAAVGYQFNKSWSLELESGHDI